MKRLLLLGLSFGMAATSWAQLSWGTQIGQTYYDLHSNRSTGNRLAMNDDGSMSATWIEHWDFLTTANEPKPAVRGFGYNYFDPTTGLWSYGPEGECWEDPFGCASTYSGWPELINMPGASWDNEIMITHTPLRMTTRSVIGGAPDANGNATVAWGNTTALGIENDIIPNTSWEGTWPRAVVGGNTIHLIATSTDPNESGLFDGTGVEMPVVYSKSTDGGATWADFSTFDVTEVVPDTTFTPVITYDTAATNVNPNPSLNTIDTTMMIDTMCVYDTVWSGSFTRGGSTFNADSVYATDSMYWNMDTSYHVATYIAMSDTGATIEACAYDTSYIYTYYDEDTLIGTTTINVVEIVGADAYAMAANGDNVAVTFGGGPDNDWLVFKSTDAGDNWTRYTVKNNRNLPVDFLGQGGADGFITNNSVYDIVIDDAGMVHVFAGMSMTDGEFIYADPALYKDAGAGIMYWNDGMAENNPMVVATPDYGYDGDTSDYNIPGGEFYGFFFQGWPSAAIDNNGGIYLMYSAVAELTEFINPTTQDTIGYNDLYMVYSKDNGVTWECMNDPINIAEDVFQQIGSTPTQDDLYAVAVSEIDGTGKMHFTWQGDWSQPGLALYEDTHPNDNLNYIHYAAMDVSGLTAGQCDVPTVDAVKEELSAQIGFTMAPNPAKEMVTISADEAFNSISIVNVMGQTVKTVSANGQTAKNINVADLNSGMYIVKVETAKGTVVEKLEIK